MYIYLISIYRWLKTSNVISVYAQSLSHVGLFVTLWTIACQAPLSMGFSRQEYWSELPFPFSGGSSWPRDWTSFSSDSCLGRQILLPLSHLGNPWKHLMLFSHWVMSNSLPPMDCGMPGIPVHHHIVTWKTPLLRLLRFYLLLVK